MERRYWSDTESVVVQAEEGRIYNFSEPVAGYDILP